MNNEVIHTELVDKPHPSSKYKESGIDYLRYLLTHLPQIMKSLRLAREVLASSYKGKKRSIGNDILKLNEGFGTQVEILGEEHIPKEGGFIFAISHVTSTTKFPGWEDRNANPHWGFAGLTLAMRKIRGESADFKLIAVDPVQAPRLIRNSVNSILVGYSGFSIDKSNSKSALRTIDEAQKAVISGDIIVISPEGEQYTELTNAKRGIARLAQSGCPVVPVAFVEERLGNRFKHTVIFGQQISLENPDSLSHLERRQNEKLFADKVGEALAQLLPEKNQGVYKRGRHR
jgi:hypothetical protein